MKKRVWTTFITLVILALVAQGCGTVKQTVPTTDELSGSWVLQTLHGQEAATLFTGELPTLVFDFARKLLTGTGGCNTYSGRFILINDLLSTPNLATTRKLCLSPNAENELFKALQEDKTLVLKAGVLQMKNKKGKVVMEFLKKADSPKGITPRQLAGVWQLSRISNQMATEIFNWEGGRIPTITFDPSNRRVTGMAGCNKFNTTYAMEGSRILISPAVSTRMSCPNLQGENLFLHTFHGALQLAMPDANTLQLLRDNQVVLEFKRGEKNVLELA